MTPEELITAACPKINEIGPAFYFTAETKARGKELGLDNFRFYFLGRGGVLGDTSAEVVLSAFGYFNPGLLATMWNSAKETVAPGVAAKAFYECCGALGSAKFAGIDGLDAFNAAAEKVISAADPTGLTLFAGIAQMPMPSDPAARAMHLIAVLREFRGSAHIVALAATGISHRAAHFIHRPEMIESFGWSKEDAAGLTDADRAKLPQAEALTDKLVLGAFSALDEPGRAAMMHGLDQMTAIMGAEQP